MNAEAVGVVDIANDLLGRRAETLDEKIAVAHWLVDMALHRYCEMEDKRHVGTVLLFSGGNDSTVLAHLMRERVTHFGHANTGIGVEDTRRFVRDTAESWSIPLLEKHPPAGETYRDLVLSYGFPGPAMHFKMYQLLKERAMRQMRRDLVKHGRRERVLFLGGIRRDESARRGDREEMHRDGAVVWVSPIVHWTDADMTEYRERFDVPRNEVSDHLHMSGECLCGAYAKPGELENVRFFYPDVAADIDQLADDARAAGIPPKRCIWGWGGWDKAELALAAGNPTGDLCSSCRLFDPDDASVYVEGNGGTA